MNGPVAGKRTWTVWTTDNTFGTVLMHESWYWAAHGPNGSESGVERNANAAVAKAQAAAMLADDSEHWTPVKP